MRTKIALIFLFSLLLIQCKSLSHKKTTGYTSTAPTDSTLPSIPPSSYPINPQIGSEEVSAPKTEHTQKQTPPAPTPSHNTSKKSETPPPSNSSHKSSSNTYCPKKIPTPSHDSGIYCDIFSEGCLYIPRTISNRPLFYIRGLIQGSPSSPPESTKALFSNSYDLESVAEAKQQILLATHKSTTTLSDSTLACLKSWSRDEKIDVASHSAGYKGLASSAQKLKNNVENLALLDNFYNKESVLSSIQIINPKNCNGFYTDHKNASGQSIVSLATSVEKNSSCNLEKKSGHIVSVSPFLRSQQNPNPVIVDSNNHNTEGSKKFGI